MKEAVDMLGQLGEGAKPLAGGQSLIPLLKLRFANPEHLVDLNFIVGTSFIDLLKMFQADPATEASQKLLQASTR